MGDGNLHRHSDLPCLLAGSLGGAIKSHKIDVDLRDWKLTSDHVPVMATFDV